jgi:3'-phosphoadenosine 5'-phosphosulfate (PAPS) 3'-phosphatase
MHRSPQLEAMIRAAEKAARRLLADFVRADGVTVEEKGPADFVTSADLASQEILERELGDAFPEHSSSSRRAVQAEGRADGPACSSTPSTARRISSTGSLISPCRLPWRRPARSSRESS